MPKEAVPPRKLLLKAARLTIKYAAQWHLPQRIELSLLLTDDAGIQALNKIYLAKDKPTDVLSFPLWEEQPPVPYRNGELALGDLVISLPRAAAQAKEYGKSYIQETVFLFIHGLLHLLGYDHEQGEKQEQVMFSMQKQLMKKMDEEGYSE